MTLAGLQPFAALVVVLAGVYLIGLAAFVLLAPAKGARFLGAFASSAFTHLLEVSLRLLVGAAILINAPTMRFGDAFTLFGWVLLVTSVGLLLIPWKWHRRFARWAVPMATRPIWLFALGSFLFGMLVLLSVGMGPDRA